MSASIESTTTIVAVSFDSVVASLKSFDSVELAKLMKATLAEMEKKMKTVSKQSSTEKKEKKKGSMAKGRTPTQLLKPRAWVDFVQAHANENGWEAFSVTDKKGVVTEFAASVVEDGKNVFADSKKPMAMKQAMSLSKIFWAPKESKGTRKELYDEFDAQYVEPVQEEVAESAESAEPAVAAVAVAPKKARAPKKTEEEKAAAKAEKKATKKAEKAVAVAPVAEKPVPAPKKSPAKKVEAEFSCPNDGNVYTFTYKGKNYMRNFDGMIWEKTADGNPGKWAGMWNGVAIDDSVPEPEYDDEE